MAKTLRKTYSLTVEYRYDTGSSEPDGQAFEYDDIKEDDLNVEILRTSIKKTLGEAVCVTKGALNSHLIGSVSET